MALFLNQMQRLAKTPLLVGADFERGASMRVTGGTRFPYNMAFGAARDLDASRYEGLVTAREARALGVQWIFAPVADVNNNPANPVINIRSFGENPEEVSQHVAAYIEGAHSDPKNRVLVTAKHFPGHGDTERRQPSRSAATDASKERMDAVELKPFQAAIAHGVDSIMTAHMAVPAIEPDDIPATVSAKSAHRTAARRARFKGMIVTDAMDMQGSREAVQLRRRLGARDRGRSRRAADAARSRTGALRAVVARSLKRQAHAEADRRERDARARRQGPRWG